MFKKELIMKPNTAIHCDTLEKAEKLCAWADSVGLRGCTGKYIGDGGWDTYRDKVCYDFIKGGFAEIEFFKNRNYKVLKLDEVLEKNKVEQLKELLKSMTLKEVGEAGISKDIYKSLVGNINIVENKPEFDDHYWFIEDLGDVVESTWKNDKSDNFRYSQCNIFNSRFDAKKWLEHINSKDKIQKTFDWIERYVVLNSSSDDQRHHYVYYDYDNKKWYTSRSYARQNNRVYMSEEMANKIINML